MRDTAALVLLALAPAVCGALPTDQSDSSGVSIRRLMTAEQFRRAGLSK